MAVSRHPLTTRLADQGPPLSYRAFVPTRHGAADRVAVPLVLVHGRSRAVARQFRAFLPTAIARDVALIAPMFAPDRFAGYQSLAGLAGPLAARDALLAVLDDVWEHLGVATDLIDLVGYSGGAQFAHRFAMLEPTRVRRVVVAAAGWYTYLDPARGFPSGAGPSPLSGARAVDVEAFLRLPVHVLVGERDVERDAGLRTGAGIDHRQGSHRLTRALRWMDHLEDAAQGRGLMPRASFDLLADCGHGFDEAVRRGELVARTYEFLGPVAPVLSVPGEVP